MGEFTVNLVKKAPVKLYQKIDESNSAYRIAEYIEDYKENIDEVNLFFISERATSEKFKDFLRIIESLKIHYEYAFKDGKEDKVYKALTVAKRR